MRKRRSLLDPSSSESAGFESAGGHFDSTPTTQHSPFGSQEALPSHQSQVPMTTPAHPQTASDSFTVPWHGSGHVGRDIRDLWLAKRSRPTILSGLATWWQGATASFVLSQEGGMGEVYEAEDLELEERVALKTVRPEIAADPIAIERLRREIQLSRRVTHPERLSGVRRGASPRQSQRCSAPQHGVSRRRDPGPPPR